MLRFLLLLLVIGAGYYFYNRPTATDLPDPMALRMVVRNSNGGIEAVQVVAVHGDRWRIETKQTSSPGTIVVVCDGSNYGASDPRIPAAKIDPRPAMSGVFKEIKGKRADGVEQINGRRYERFSVTYNGAQAHAWVDPQTGFPVRVQYPSKRGGFQTMEYLLLPVAVAQRGEELFNTRSTTSLLAEHLRVR